MTETKNPLRRDMSDDEISLVDLTLILMRRKVWAIGVFVVIVLGGVAQVVLTPHPGYEGQARVAMIDVPEGGWSVVPGLVREDADGALEDNRERLLERIESLVADASVNVSINHSGNWLYLKAHAVEPDAIRALYEDVEREAPVMMESHWLPYARSVASGYQARMNELSRRAKRLNVLASEAGPGEALAHYVAAEAAVLERIDHEMALAERKGPLESLMQAWRDEELGEADVVLDSVSEVSSRSALVIALTMVLGLVAGIFAAFFAEFIAKVRRQAGGS